jgi:hypothetical protein
MPRRRHRVSDVSRPACTIAEARHNAESALALHCQLLRDTDAPLPPPSDMHQIAWSRERTDGLVVLIAPPEAA